MTDDRRKSLGHRIHARQSVADGSSASAGVALLKEEKLVISMHCGSSPREADFAFASMGDLSPYDGSTGLLGEYVLTVLGASAADYPSPVVRHRGVVVVPTPAGTKAVFVVTVRQDRPSEVLLLLHLRQALDTLREQLGGRRIWLPLLATGAGGVHKENSIAIALNALLEADLTSLKAPVDVRLDLPVHLSLSRRLELLEFARSRLELVMPDRVIWESSDEPLRTVPVRSEALWYVSVIGGIPGSPSMREAAESQLAKSILDRSEVHNLTRESARREVAAAADAQRPLSAPDPSRQHLSELLVDLFDESELRRWAYFALGEEVHHALPGPAASQAELAFQVVLQASQRGLIGVPLFEALVAHRPARHDAIQAVAMVCLDMPLSLPALPAENSPTQPSYLDAEARRLGQALERAQARKQALENAGADASEPLAEILRLKREIRRGGRLAAGDMLADGRYLLLECVGSGGFATVWRALDRAADTHVAVKVLHSEHAGNALRRDRFFRGARFMKKLDHPAIVRVRTDYGEDDGYHYFVMEFVPGGDLCQAIRAGTIPDARIPRLLLQLGDAVAYAHERGVVHRDVKPSNILLTAAGEPRLTDFDLVAAIDTTGGTRTGPLGTLLFAAPEALERPQDADARADVYGLAMTAVNLLYGADLPAKAILRRPESFIRGLECEPALEQLLLRSIAWEPEHRPADARGFCAELRACSPAG